MAKPCRILPVLFGIPLVAAGASAWAQSVLIGFEAASGARPPPPWQVIAERRQRPPQFDVVEQEGHRVLMVYAADAEGRLEHPLALPTDAPLRLTWRWRVDEHAVEADLAQPERDDHALRLCVRIAPDPERAGERTRRGLAALLGGATRHLLCYLWDARYPAGHMAWAADETTRLIVLRGNETATGRWQFETRDLLADYQEQFGAEPRTLEAVWVSARTKATRARSLAYLADLSLAREP